MADVKAYAINTIKDGSDTYVASTKERPSIFSIDKKKFEALVKQSAVREPTKEELALWKAQQEALGNGEPLPEPEDEDVEEEDVEEDTSKSGTIQAPASNAKGDPKNVPKGASKDKDDLGV